MTHRVLVTGATGFVAGHCIAELIEHGYDVRATVRDIAATARRAHLEKLAADRGGSIEFVQADLDSDDGWDPAVTDCAYVIHTASPFPDTPPKDPDELVRPAVDGTLRILRACAASDTVRRVVITSSIAAVSAGREPGDHTVRTERDWSVLDRSTAYQQSKTLAERAAWDFVAGLPADRSLELVVINPGMVLGPVQQPVVGTSVNAIVRLLRRDMPGSPRLGFAPIDVRDLAAAHRLAMESPDAVGNRYICAGDNIWMGGIAQILAEEYNRKGFRVPTRTIPDRLIRIIGYFDPSVRLILPWLGRHERVSSDKARRELSWEMRPVRETILDTAASLIRHGIVPAPYGASAR
ncbi:SDR family oxidoreductase [Nocardia carnea]|uniref:SDR family oxidoreductase n=1 Tax=Nocardia carnea TaxID=37328 RepID=UPI0024562F3D|nr:aldehyde reductase [Nocardia carnea]